MKQEFYKMGYEDWDEGVECFGIGESALILEAAYLRLCHLMYRRRGAVTSDIQILARLWSVPVEQASDLLKKLTDHGKIQELSGGHLVNTRVAKELTHRGVLSAKRADAGKAGGKKSADSRANQMLLFVEAIASDEAKQNPQRREEEEKEKENISAPRAKKQKHGSKISEEWIPTATDREYARGKRLTDSDIGRQAEGFRDYHLSKGTLGQDWQAAWRTWIRNSIDFGKVKLAPEPTESLTNKPSFDMPLHGERITDSMCPHPHLKQHVGKIFVLFDSKEWHAWGFYIRETARKNGTTALAVHPIFSSKDGKGWSFPDRWPPGQKQA